MTNLRGALIGCGFFARNHLHAWREVIGAEIVALCDQDPKRADTYAREFQQLYCQTARINLDIQGEDVATIMLQSEQGATCIVDMCYASRPIEELFPQTLIHLEGDRGALKVGPHFQLDSACDGRVQHWDARPVVRSWYQSPREVIQDSVLPTQQHWIDCLREGRAPDTSGHDNLKTLALVFSAYRSAQLQRPVSPTECEYDE